MLRLVVAASAAIGISMFVAAARGDTWTNVTAAPTGLGTMELMSDGTVLAQGGGVSSSWYKLTPNSAGSYSAGTWSQAASMSTQRLYMATNILQDGRMFVLGGEYSGASGADNDNNTGEIYNPQTNTWTGIANYPLSAYGDVPATVLPNGNILAGSISTTATYIYNVSANSWSAGGTKLHGDQSDEETWAKLPDGSILSYDVFSQGHAQRYIPATNTWTDAGSVPVNLTTSGSELGGALRLPDGRVFFIGANSNTALYTPSTNTWAAGPVIPNSLGANDAPCAIMPNGKVLFVATQTPGFGTPTQMYIYDPTTNTISAAATAGAPALTSAGYVTRMLVLPSGQVLFNNGASGSGALTLYTGTGSPSASWKPTISSVKNNGNGTYTLTGTQINGISEGASYGDDAEMSTNFPIVQFVDSAGHVLYGRSYNWSSTGVATGSLLETVNFTLPTGLVGDYSVSVVANGIASDAFALTPEPSSASLFAIAALGLLRYRPRRERART